MYFFQSLKLLRKEAESLRQNVLKLEAVTKAAKVKYDDEYSKLSDLSSQFRAADVIRQEAFAKLQALRERLHEKVCRFLFLFFYFFLKFMDTFCWCEVLTYDIHILVLVFSCGLYITRNRQCHFPLSVYFLLHVLIILPLVICIRSCLRNPV